MKNKKCDKFEELFCKDDDTELMEHIKSCEDCRQEYEKIIAVSNLVKEAKPLFAKEKFQKRSFAVSMVAGFSILCLTAFVIMSWLPSYNYEQAIASEVYPMDEYGLVEFY